METAKVALVDIFIMFLAAKVAGELFERARQPAVIGELLVGILIGPFAFGLVGMPSPKMIQELHGLEVARETLHIVHETLAELGVIILLFCVGLETRLSDVTRVGVRATLVAVAGVVVPFGLGYAFVSMLGYRSIEAIFVGTALVATSVGITARVLADLGHLNSDEARIILGAAVIDDVIGMIVLAFVSALGQGESMGPIEIAALASQAIGFTVLVALAGEHVIRRWSPRIELLRIRNAPFVVAVLLMLGLAALASKIGLAAIIGAFLAGMAFAELRQQYELERQALPLYELLVPLFFVITGARVDWRVFLDSQTIGIALAVTALAIIGKLVGCGAGAWGMPWRSVAVIGVGMAPRGEVGLIVASVGASLAVISQQMFSTVVVMSVLTTLVVPPILVILYRAETPDRSIDTDYAVADGRLPDL
jgi:Kef-type K+ transport system membrane component KefB